MAAPWHVLDSSTPPGVASLRAAATAGIKAWNGYLPGPGIDKAWTAADFARCRAILGHPSVAYASQSADPTAMRAQAAAWGVIGCLDCEAGIVAFNSETQAWLSESGFGFYHQRSGYPNVRAPFHIVANYVASNPGEAWPPGMPHPLGPTGWQYLGNVPSYGVNTDRCCFDPAIYPQPLPPPTPTPMPPPTEDRSVIAVIKPGDPPFPIPSFTGGSTMNLVSEGGAAFTVFVYDNTGTPLAAPTLALVGNQPGVKGPAQVSGSVAQVCGLPALDGKPYAGPVTLVFYAGIQATGAPIANPYTASVT